jgi:TRAP-type C4-dicarboxylate transport system permease small subunit
MLQKFHNGVGKVSNAVNYIGLASLFAMVFIVAIDVILRKLSGSTLSIKGSNELTNCLMVYACVLGIPVLLHNKGHVWVDLLVNKFPKRAKSFWMFFILLVETAVIAMFIYGAFRNVSNLIGPPAKRTFILNLPQWMFAISVIVAFVEYFFLSLADTVEMLFEGIHPTAEPKK